MPRNVLSSGWPCTIQQVTAFRSSLTYGWVLSRQGRARCGERALCCKDNFINWDPVGSFCLKKLFFPPYLHSLSGHLLLKTQQNTALTFTSIALKTKWDEYYGKTGSISLLTPLGFRSDSQKMSVWLSCCALSIALQSVIMSAFLTALSGDHFSSNLVSNNKDKISYKYFCGFLFAEL